jgi:hypothetical protein
MYVCMYVCMHVCMYVCVSDCLLMVIIHSSSSARSPKVLKRLGPGTLIIDPVKHVSPPSHMTCMYPPPHMTCMYPPPHMTLIIDPVKPSVYWLLSTVSWASVLHVRHIRRRIHVFCSWYALCMRRRIHVFCSWLALCTLTFENFCLSVLFAPDLARTCHMRGTCMSCHMRRRIHAFFSWRCTDRVSCACWLSCRVYFRV